MEPSPINYNPWNKRFSPIDPEYQREIPHTSQRSHPYQRNNHPVSRPQPSSSSSSSSKIPSLLTLELPPKPLFLPQDVERLRAKLNNSQQRVEPELYDEYEDCNDSPPTVEEPLNEEEYLREEKQTKQQIEEIIAVAQALREKLDREEELRRQTEQSIPKLMDLKPKIPSLLDIYVQPPPMMPEEICWNCRTPGHRFVQCTLPQQRRFCYRCGIPDFDAGSCPNCKNFR